MSRDNLGNKVPEKEYFVRPTHTLNIKELLQVPSEFRTFSHCKEIINHVKVKAEFMNLLGLGCQVLRKIHGDRANI